MKMSSSPQQKLSPEDFINQPEVVACIDKLKQKFGNDFEKLLVSDTLDASGHQYVNLVQKGGGVLGIALVGYTYVLEQAKIRFMRLAGTSAGAINTAMLASIGEKDNPKASPKWEKVLQYLCDLDFFQLVDGHPFARWLIRNFITNKVKFEEKVKTWILGILGSLVVLLALNIVFLGLSHYYEWASFLVKLSFVLTGINLLIIIFLSLYIYSLLGRLKDSGYGINPGDFFYDWIKKIFIENGVCTIADLNAKVSAPIVGLRVRKPETQDVSTLKGDVTFIASELVSQNKIEFPLMWDLFREKEDELQPAGFVRASMSIPIFFESYMIMNIPKNSALIQDAWFNHFKTRIGIPAEARFVDGGMLSNFPVSIFYNPKIIEPRLPSFGIDLDDSEPNAKDKQDPANWGLGDYMGRMFNTIRYYYDKDFLVKNNVFQKGIGTIKLSEFNWLNFFISDDDKKKMFIKGAQAASDFLMDFDWLEYQKERIGVQQSIDHQEQH